MADLQVSGHPAMDYAEHERTYHFFLKATKWSTIALVCLMVFMAVTLL